MGRMVVHADIWSGEITTKSKVFKKLDEVREYAKEKGFSGIVIKFDHQSKDGGLRSQIRKAVTHGTSTGIRS